MQAMNSNFTEKKSESIRDNFQYSPKSLREFLKVSRFYPRLGFQNCAAAN